CGPGGPPAPGQWAMPAGRARSARWSSGGTGRGGRCCPAPTSARWITCWPGVDTVSADDSWAVGYAARVTPRGAFHRALIEHWDGSTWRVVPAPHAGTED